MNAGSVLKRCLRSSDLSLPLQKFWLRLAICLRLGWMNKRHKKNARLIKTRIVKHLYEYHTSPA